jgi:hypothetical protein
MLVLLLAGGVVLDPCCCRRSERAKLYPFVAVVATEIGLMLC